MPLYEYHCLRCDQRFEKLVRCAEAAESATCPACGGEVRRLLSTFAARFGQSYESTGASSCTPVGGG